MNSGDKDFGAWFNGVRSQADFGDGWLQLEPGDPDLEWVHCVYRDRGPISAVSFRRLVIDKRMAVCRAALRAFLGTLEHEHREPFRTVAAIAEVVNNDNRSVYLLGAELFALSFESAVTEIAEIIQDEIIERGREVWPVCGQHHTGLHARLAGRRSVWWCQSGNHDVRLIVAANAT